MSIVSTLKPDTMISFRDAEGLTKFALVVSHRKVNLMNNEGTLHSVKILTDEGKIEYLHSVQDIRII